MRKRRLLLRQQPFSKWRRMMFPYIDLGIVYIPVYSSLFIVAFFLAVLAARKRGRRFGISKEDVLYGSIYAVIGILIGAKVLYFITKIWIKTRKEGKYLWIKLMKFMYQIKYLTLAGESIIMIKNKWKRKNLNGIDCFWCAQFGRCKYGGSSNFSTRC